ncbi:hypothetical protein [Arthrobacter wenxiniae]|uniref:Uncharacterized protein n=1 Tax=Arthrobacter wenxiniae TaxID=2713570 RepID=A0A7Y7IIG6_9MICC|nr:hypothetical protein [Arthrobacter wenxiniae]NVM96108.1 hypothetical protein [Arthrobacter wenxiniae]
MAVDTDGFEREVSSTQISCEVIARTREPDYALHLDEEREQNLLMEDGVEIFVHRSHDQVLNRYSYLTGDPLIGEFWFQDADDPDRAWKVTAEMADREDVNLLPDAQR